MTKKILLVSLALLISVVAVIVERINAQNMALAILRASQSVQDKAAAELRMFRERDEALTQEAAQLRDRLAQAKAGVLEAPGTSSDNRNATVKEDSDAINRMAKVLNEPETRQLVRAQQAERIRTMYGDLWGELGLSPGEANKAMELLATRVLNANDIALQVADGKPGADVQAAINAQQQLKAMLGPAGIKRLTEYERTLGDRAAMQGIASTFSTAGYPLADAQRTDLLKIMMEERLKAPPGQQHGNSSEQAIENERVFQQHVYARAHTVLTPDQMITFESLQKQDIQSRELTLKMNRAMSGDEKGK
jgi:hypothetical protein